MADSERKPVGPIASHGCTPAGLTEQDCLRTGLWQVLDVAQDQEALELAAGSLRARAPFALTIAGGWLLPGRALLAAHTPSWAMPPPHPPTPPTHPLLASLGSPVCKAVLRSGASAAATTAAQPSLAAPCRRCCLAAFCWPIAGWWRLSPAGPAGRQLTLELRPATADHLSAAMPPVGIPNLMESSREAAGGAGPRPAAALWQEQSSLAASWRPARPAACSACC